MRQATPIGHRARSAARFAPSCSRDVAHESRSAEAEALAWARVHGGGGAARGREGRHAEGTREAEEAARASGTGRRGAWHLQRVRDRLGARSSAMTKTTTQPAVRAEGRSPRQARSPPAWRIETSLRRKRVRGGGSRRARAVRQGPTHLTPARERVASSADLSAPRMAPLGAETPRKPVNATASCRETATRSAPGPAQEDRRVRSGHARLPEPWRHEMEGWSAAGALAGGGGSSGVAGARGGVNVLRAPAGPGRAPPLRSGARPGPAARSAKI